ncbi:MAG: rRNA maturation RNase YbeY [Armatimonadetes bacterium]|nr:rRNA maturation RNase YbeY [Armatimonadota bacterium]
MNTRKLNPIFFEKKTSIKFDESTFSRVWRIIAENENLKKDAFVNVLITDDETIKTYNKKYLGRNEATDVISFSAEISQISFLGDIIIDIEQAEKQKDTESLNTELQRLFLHGLLHLLGYDHLSVAQENIMKLKEKEYWKLMSSEK